MKQSRKRRSLVREEERPDYCGSLCYMDSCTCMAYQCCTLDTWEVEKDVKARTKGEMGAAKTLCSPFDQPALDEGVLCFASGKPAKKWTYWGRSY
ncbi:hypothetical protein CsSME_00039738 [Camellia sinensis var. sinensis]